MKKKEMLEEWEQAKTTAQLPVIEGLLEQGRVKKAKEELSKCLQANPEMAGAYVLVGRIHFIETHNEKAREAFEHAVQLDPQLHQAWHFLGALAVLDKDYDEAVENFQRALELMPYETDYILSLSDVYLETKEFEKAEQQIETGLSEHPQNLELLLAKAQLYQQMGRIQEATRVYEQAQLMHGDQAQILEPCGYAYIVQKEWKRAAEKFDLILEQYKNDEDRYHTTMLSLATCLYNSEQYGKALYWYDKLSLVYRDDADIWMNMAQAALNLDDGKRASYCATKALQINPSWADAYAVLGSARYIQGLYEQSLQAFYKISADEELGAFAWFMSGRCYQQLGQNRQANAAFERAEELDPNNQLIASFLKKTVHPL
jgi:tetratricopeptide (TPR) repeat protein